MKIKLAFQVFFRVLFAKQWYLVIESEDSYMVSENITIGQLEVQVKKSIDNAIGQESVLGQAKDILGLN